MTKFTGEIRDANNQLIGTLDKDPIIVGIIEDSSNTSFALYTHDHTGTHPKKYSAALAAQATQTITHNLNTEDVTVTIRETSGTSKQIIYTDVKITGKNTIEVAFATAPGASEYTVIVIG